ncbi:MAG TPA: ATPase, partial [Sulfurimonas sp. UBA12504]
MRTPSISTTQLYKNIEILLETDTPLFIHGSPGIGKS